MYSDQADLEALAKRGVLVIRVRVVPGGVRAGAGDVVARVPLFEDLGQFRRAETRRRTRRSSGCWLLTQYQCCAVLKRRPIAGRDGGPVQSARSLAVIVASSSGWIVRMSRRPSCGLKCEIIGRQILKSSARRPERG